MSRQLRIWLVLAIFASTVPGCLFARHPSPVPPCHVCQQFDAIDEDCRAGVYIFFMNGNDPFGYANLKGVRDYLSQLGFSKTYFGEIGHEGWMAEEIVCIHRDHPGSRFIVVGFEYGADPARRMVAAALKRGAPIDLLLFLEPRGSVFNAPSVDPGINRTVVMQTDTLFAQSAPIEGAEVIKVKRKSRYELPTQLEVIDLLVGQASLSAEQVPIVIDAPEPVPALLDETAPTPRPVVERPSQTFDEWDFLKRFSRRDVRHSLHAKSLATGQPLLPRPRNSNYQMDNPYNALRPVSALSRDSSR